MAPLPLDHALTFGRPWRFATPTSLRRLGESAITHDRYSAWRLLSASNDAVARPPAAHSPQAQSCRRTTKLPAPGASLLGQMRESNQREVEHLAGEVVEQLGALLPPLPFAGFNSVSDPRTQTRFFSGVISFARS